MGRGTLKVGIMGRIRLWFALIAKLIIRGAIGLVPECRRIVAGVCRRWEGLLLLGLASLDLLQEGLR